MRPDRQSPPVMDLVLVGAGHAHVEVLRRFAMAPVAGLRLTLITREIHTPYSGMLPGLIAGLYTFDEAHIDAGALARAAGARLYHDRVVGLDTEARQVICEARPPVRYDLVSLDIGSTPNLEAVPGAREYAIPVKPIDGFNARWDALAHRAMQKAGHITIGIAGGGAGGVELALSVKHRLDTLLGRQGGEARPNLWLATRSDVPLPQFNTLARRKLARALRKAGIEVITSAAVTRVEDGNAHLETGRDMAFDALLWVTQASAAPWLADSGLALDARGFVRVNEHLQSVSHPHVFAAGDIAAMNGHPRPKSGVFAVRQGPPLTANLRRAATGKLLVDHRPQSRFLSIISTGERHAVAIWGPFAVEGDWVWRLKDNIDRRFMERYAELPPMPEPEAVPPQARADAAALEKLTAHPMRCAGCGAKVGGAVLARALDGLDRTQVPGVLIGLDAPDDAAVFEVPPGKALVQTVDYFPAFIADPYRFGRIAANHCLGDLYAMGAEPHSALAIVTLPLGGDTQMEDDHRQLMAGAEATLREAGAALLGGHTSEGETTAFGLAVNGLVASGAILRKGRLRSGQALILTRPLGTGVILAADMRGAARARDVEAALTRMEQSNAKAAGIMRDMGATAATDVTGFGLIGHLVEMVQASKVGAEIELAAVPLLDGALDATEAGIASSLTPDNLASARAIANAETAAAHPAYPLLFDPQTAGGLLFSVRQSRAEACLAALREAGYDAACVIGRVTKRADDGPAIRLV